MESVTNVIGERYKNWDKEIVYIAAPTGSGKTTFIVSVLFPYVIQEKKRILYLVNRKILMEQINKEINDIDINYKAKGILNAKKSIVVNTYQAIEEKDIQESYDYIVCDEAHYFLGDSLFNTRTIKSYCNIASFFFKKTIIFMSATLEDWEDIICNIEPTRRNLPKSELFDPLSRTYESFQRKMRNDRDGCKIDEDYSYIDLKFFRNMDQMIDLICNTDKKEKWLIFFNDIKKSEEIRDELNHMDVDAICVDSEYENDEMTAKLVNTLVENRNVNHRVTIATSVLDNGISISDDELCNVVILAETKVEMIQMLGRKRKDGKQLKVYLSFRSKNEFVRRKNEAQIIDNVYRKCENYIASGKQYRIFEEIMQSELFYNAARKILYFDNSMFENTVSQKYLENIQLEINPFSVLKNARNFKMYDEIIEEFEKSDDVAFLRIQLRWLGFSDEKIEEIISINLMEEKERLIKEVVGAINQHVGEKMDAKMNIRFKKEELFPKLKILLNYYVEDDEKKMWIEKIRPKNRILSVKVFNEVMELLELPYVMKKENDNFIIENSKGE